MKRLLLSITLIAGLLLPSLAHPSAAIAERQLLIWGNGQEYASFSANQSIVIDVGSIDFVRFCGSKGSDDFFTPFADVYVFPSGSVDVGGDLTDASGRPNTVEGATLDGTIISEPIGFTKPSGKIEAGVYAVAYDQCQDGTLDPGDFLRDPAFEVGEIPTDVRKLPSIAGLKREAAVEAIKWENFAEAIKTAQKIPDLWGQFQSFTKFTSKVFVDGVAKAVRALLRGWLQGKLKALRAWAEPKEVAKKQHGKLRDQMIDRAREQVLQMAKHYRGIAADPPDPNFRQITPLRPRDAFDVETDDPVTVSLAEIATATNAEQGLASALLTSLERFQGAEEADNGDWALIHARAIRDYATLLADQLDYTIEALAGESAALADYPESLDEFDPDYEAFRNRVVASGFTTDEIREARNLGITPEQMAEFRAELAITDPTFDKASLLSDIAELQSSHIATQLELRTLAADMAPIIAELEADPLALDGAPVVDAGGPYVYTEGTPAVFDGTGSTSPVSITDFAWDLDGDGAFDDAVGATPSFTVGAAHTGWVGLRVTNAAGWSNIGYASLVLTEANRPPSISTVSPETGISMFVGTTQVFSASAQDPDGDLLTFQWAFDGDFVSTGSEFTYTPSAAEVGTHLIDLAVTDGNPLGGTIRETFLVLVLMLDEDEDFWRANIDCDDTDPTVNPGQPEILGNGKDDDCSPENGDNGSAPAALFNPTGTGRNVALFEGGASVVAVSSKSTSSPIENLINFSSTDTGWITAVGQTTGQFAIIQFDGANPYLIDRIKIKPRATGLSTTRVSDFAIDVSTTTTADAAFTTVLTATAANNGNLQEFVLSEPVLAKYVRYRPLTNRGGTSIGTDQLKILTGQEGAAAVTFRDLTVDTNDDAVSWQWDFGDGTSSSEQHPAHVFPAPGAYDVALTVTDGRGNSDTFSLTQRVYAPPEASFTFTPALPDEASPVTFTGTAADSDGGTIVQRRWSWGDGDSLLETTAANVRTHSYFDSGEFTVTWEVIDSQEQVTTIEQVVPVQNVPPTVDVGRDRRWADGSVLDFPVNISDPAGDTFTCSWNFGDGSQPSTSCRFGHVYDIPAGALPTTFTATLVVTDQDGGVSSDSLEISVSKADVLILSTSLQAGADSFEVQMAEELGLAVEIASPAEWSAKSAADFASYKALILADPDSRLVSRVAAAEATKAIWGQAITGNVIIVGSDLSTHASQGGDQLVRSGLAFATADPGKTGAFIALSEYYHDTANETPIPLLDVFSPQGFTARGVGCYNDAHIVATHPALAGLTDTHLSNWNCSVHEALDRWPDDFLVLAIARGIGAYYTAADGSSGTPYILARGNDLQPIRDIVLAPETASPPTGTSHVLTATVDEGGTLSVGKTVTFTVTAGPHSGITGTVDTNDQGIATFPYTGTNIGIDTIVATFTDAQGETQTSNEASVEWVASTNRLPVVADQSASTSRNTLIDLTLLATDEDGDSLTFTVVDPPAHGTLSGTAPALTYEPESGFVGVDTFTFQATDGFGGSTIATVTIEVQAGSAPPVAAPQEVITDEDAEVAVVLTASDPDGDGLIYTIVDAPVNGILSGDAPDLIYTPNADFNGTDAFTFIANDGTADSNVAMLTIQVVAANDPPLAVDQELTTEEDTALEIVLSGSDADGDALEFTIGQQPAHGTLTGDAPNLTYTPEASYFGSDAFTFSVNDGEIDSNVATATITVEPSNDPSHGDHQTIETDEDTIALITLTASDPDGDTLSYAIVDSPAHGGLSGMAPDLTYTPNPDFHGTDMFTFTANDGVVDSDAATLTIQVSPVNDPPKALGKDVTADEDTAREIVLSGGDVDGDALIYVVRQQPTHGVITGDEPNLTYTPESNYFGSDTFTFTTNDGAIDSDAATVSITVEPRNDPPRADGQVVETDEDTEIAVSLIGSDVDGDELAFGIVDDPAHATLSGTAPNLSYAPAGSFSGEDAFTFIVNDGTDNSETASVRVKVKPVNDPPITEDQAVNTDEDVSVAVTLLATDVEGDALDFAIVDGPTHGTLAGKAPDLTFTPNPEFSGTDAFTVRANDGQVDSNVATVSITVAPVNDPPVADAGGPYEGVEGSPVEFDGRGSADIEGSELAFAWDPDYDGSAFAPDPALTERRQTYTYLDDAETQVALQVTDADGGQSAIATAEVRIANVDPTIEAGGDAQITLGDQFTRDGAFSDPGADEWTATVNYGDGAGPETLIVNADKTFSLEHEFTSAGDHTVRLCVTDDDGGEGCDAFTVSANAPPVCVDARSSVSEIWPPNHEFVAVDVRGVTDPDGEDVGITITGIHQDEPVDTTGDGQFVPDGEGVGTAQARVRAERSGTPKVPGNGRVYHITFTAADPHGATCAGDILVAVPHDRSTPAVDDGPLYDATSTETNHNLDTTPPDSLRLAIREVGDDPDQHVDASDPAQPVVYYNPAVGRSGAFTVIAEAEDLDSSMTSVRFPAMLGGDEITLTDTPYERTYEWSIASPPPPVVDPGPGPGTDPGQDNGGQNNGKKGDDKHANDKKDNGNGKDRTTHGNGNGKNGADKKDNAKKSSLKLKQESAKTGNDKKDGKKKNDNNGNGKKDNKKQGNGQNGHGNDKKDQGKKDSGKKNNVKQQSDQHGSAQQGDSQPVLTSVAAGEAAMALASDVYTVTATNAAGLTLDATFRLVPDTTLPTVSFASAEVDQGLVTVEATDKGGAGIASVEVRTCPEAACTWDAAKPIGETDTEAPFIVEGLSPSATGTQTVLARAVDEVGNATVSDPMHIAPVQPPAMEAPTDDSQASVVLSSEPTAAEAPSADTEMVDEDVASANAETTSEIVGPVASELGVVPSSAAPEAQSETETKLKDDKKHTDRKHQNDGKKPKAGKQDGKKNHHHGGNARGDNRKKR